MTIEVHAAGGSCPIYVGDGVFSSLGEITARHIRGVRATVVSDANVGNFYMDRALESLRCAGISAEGICVPAGEGSKSIEMLCTLWNTLHGYGMTRSDAVVALGGGVVGDLAGFAAATFMRGCPVVQVPTSLLAQVDSSIGGKTAIDMPYGKNLIGAFHQPAAVVTDPQLLSTLPPDRFTEGMAEVVKYGCICDAELFCGIENGTVGTEEIVVRCAEIKAGVVSRDEFDSGERMKLNFGHTVGHAVENVMGYGWISHGEAVSVGMVASARLGERMGITASGVSERLAALLTSLGLPVKCEFGVSDLSRALLADKKMCSKGIRFVMLRDIGVSECVTVASEDLLKSLEWVIGQ